MTIWEPVKVSNRRYSSSIAKTSDILLNHFNLNKFYYYKIHNSGRSIVFDSSLDILECYELHSLVDNYAPFCHPQFHQSGFQMIRYDEDPLYNELEPLRESFIQSGFSLCIRLINKTSDGVEEIGFSSSKSDQSQCDFLVDRLAELRTFSRWILDNNVDLFAFLEESPLDFPSLVGPLFYKNRIQKSDSSYLRRKRFLEKLGIQSELVLSAADLDTVSLVLRGHTAVQIAEKLYRSKRTIEHRLENIKVKLKCSSKRELIQKVQDLGHLGYGAPWF